MTAPFETQVGGTTDLLQSAIDAVRGLPPETQDEIARAILGLTRLTATADETDIDAEIDEDLLESIAEADRGEFASDEEVRAVWAKHGL
jgi:hypothetical protein